jgi:DNA-binding response OmpR family regulator
MKGHILIVDDEASIRDLLSSYLRNNGFVVTTACSGEEALKACKNEKLDLITLDVVLPNEDGLEVLAKIRSLDPVIPVIMATGNDPIEVIGVARRRGATAFASKTAPLSELLAQVEILVGLK